MVPENSCSEGSARWRNLLPIVVDLSALSILRSCTHMVKTLHVCSQDELNSAERPKGLFRGCVTCFSCPVVSHKMEYLQEFPVTWFINLGMNFLLGTVRLRVSSTDRIDRANSFGWLANSPHSPLCDPIRSPTTREHSFSLLTQGAWEIMVKKTLL